VPERDHDRSVEHVLRHVLSSDVPAQPQSTCPDAETIAAWHEGALRAEDVAAMECHAADCPRCRALMAAFIQTAPVAPVVESFWRRWHLGWTVPLATAATAAALWIATPRNTPGLQLSNREASPVAVDATVAATLPPASPPAAAAPEPSAPTSAESLQSSNAAVRSQLQKRISENESNLPRLADERAAADAALSTRIEADKSEPATINAAPRSFAAAQEVAVPGEIVAPGGVARWRIVSGQQIEWSTIASTEWGPASIEAPGVLTAGAAPSATVCWIVGRRGAVYVTTDGKRFVRVPFPEMSDLVAVSATDERTATVSSADGRSWSTTDQGNSWSTAR
jgi:hypothetical protein